MKKLILSFIALCLASATFQSEGMFKLNNSLLSLTKKNTVKKFPQPQLKKDVSLNYQAKILKEHTNLVNNHSTLRINTMKSQLAMLGSSCALGKMISVTHELIPGNDLTIQAGLVALVATKGLLFCYLTKANSINFSQLKKSHNELISFSENQKKEFKLPDDIQ